MEYLETTEKVARAALQPRRFQVSTKQLAWALQACTRDIVYSKWRPCSHMHQQKNTQDQDARLPSLFLARSQNTTQLNTANGTMHLCSNKILVTQKTEDSVSDPCMLECTPILSRHSLSRVAASTALVAQTFPADNCSNTTHHPHTGPLRNHIPPTSPFVTFTL